MSTAPVLEIHRLVKAYSGLRPLRLRALEVAAGERVAVRGLDAAAAELLVNLVTGAALPDEGVVRIEGRSTAEITDGDEWLQSLDRFGIVSGRAVLLEDAALVQNLAMPFTLAIDPVPAPIREQVQALAVECGIPEVLLDVPAGRLPSAVRVRAHLGRAIALDPRLLIVEHPTADVPPADRQALAFDLARVAEIRRLAALIVTMDEAFASASAHRTLTLNASTGDLAPPRKGWFR